jgi:hypothetical protein
MPATRKTGTKTKAKAKAKPKAKARVKKPKHAKAAPSPKRKAHEKAKTPAKRERAAAPIPQSDAIPSPRPSAVPMAPPIATESSPRPVDSALAVVAQIPKERSLTDEERDAMAKVAQTAQRFLAIDGVPEAVVRGIGSFVDEVRTGKRTEPKGQDLRLGLGVLWGEQVRAQVGWRWVHLTYPSGFASYALVPDDRAFACFPLNRLPELMKSGHTTNTSARLFQRIRAGELPTRRENAYLVIG